MSTLEEQQSSHSYSDDTNFIIDFYLYFLFIYVGIAVVISGIIMYCVYKASKKEKIKMVKK